MQQHYVGEMGTSVTFVWNILSRYTCAKHCRNRSRYVDNIEKWARGYFWDSHVVTLVLKTDERSKEKCFHVRTIWLEPLLGMKKCLEHSFVEEHVTHRFRDDDVNQLRKVDLFNLAWDNGDTVWQKVVLYERLKMYRTCRLCKLSQWYLCVHVYNSELMQTGPKLLKTATSNN